LNTRVNKSVTKRMNNKAVPLVAHIIHRFAVGGLENGLVNLINRMPEDRYDHVIICLTQSSDFSQRLNRNIPIYELNKQEGKDPGLYWRLWKLLRKLQPDLVHTRNLATLEGQFCAFLAGVKARVHGEHGWDIQDLSGKTPRYLRMRKLFRPLIDHYIPLSIHQQHYLTEVVGVRQERFTTIRNGVDTDRFCPALSQDEPDVSLLPDGFMKLGCILFGTVGRLEPVKDQLTLVRAFALAVKQSNSDKLRLLLVGDGSRREETVRLVKEEGIENFVYMAGSRDDIPELMGEMDVFVLPSLAEGISNTILEAMASGLPVIATDVGGNAELIEEGVTGYLLPAESSAAMAEPIVRYLQQPGLIEQHGRAARTHALKEFSLGQMVENYQAVYDRVLCRNVDLGAGTSSVSALDNEAERDVNSKI